MIRKPISRLSTILLGAASILLILTGYTLMSQHQHRKNPADTTIPNWSQLAEGVKKVSEYNTFDKGRWILLDLKASGIRFFLGLAWGVAGAVVVGMLMGCFTPAEAFFYPPMSLLAKVPPTAALAVFFVLCNIELGMHVAMIAFGILPTLAMTVYLSVKAFPDELQFKAYTLGASHTEVILTIIFRQVLPNLIEAVRLVIGPAMVFLIAAELVVGEPGIGYRIRLQFKQLNMNVVYPYLVLLAGFGYLMDYLLHQLQRKLCPWYEDHRR